ncbi:MAG TPA: hypothetical protein VFL36_14815 [Myxococcales bacterium]|nr:hypothetical protein [Myxococcales bacterium]
MRIALLCTIAALGCGGTSRPRDVRASAVNGAVEVTWAPAVLVGTYRVQLADLDSGTPRSEAVTVHGNHATLQGTASGVWVDAVPGGRATGVVSGGGQGGTGGGWQFFAPWDFRDGALTVRYPALGADERLGVLLVNAGGPDEAQAAVSVDGAAPPAQVAPASGAALQLSRGQPASPGLHEAVRAQELELAGVAPAAAEIVAGADHRAFCVVPGLDFSRHLRKPATRAASSADVDLYVDDEDLAHYAPGDLQQLAATLEERVLPAVTGVFGAPSDVDGNGKLLVLLSHELGAHLNGGWLIGYFGNADLVRARDDSAACSGTGSNHAEIVYLNDVDNGVANGYTAQDLLATTWPATVAHELQHLLNFAHRCVEHACDGPEETWINEALSKVAEDVAGFGWNASGGRAEGAAYLGRDEGAVRGYDGRSLTKWEGDPIGNYQGAHSFLRFFADQLGPAVAGQVAAGPGGVAGLEAALGRPLPRAMAEWATALLLSNEPSAPYSFSGTPWSPLHARLRHLDTRDPGPVTLRADGIAAVTSGTGQGGPVTVTVKSGAAQPPYVVVVRASSALPPR